MGRALVLFMFLTTISCGGGGGGGSSDKKETRMAYSIHYVYPENNLKPGDGKLFVSPLKVECRDSLEVVVDDSKCPGIEDVDLAKAPEVVLESPPGPIEINVPNTVGAITVNFEKGQTFEDIPVEERISLIESQTSCVSGYMLSYQAECLVPSFVYHAEDFPSNTLSSCQGSITYNREITCISNITGGEVDLGECDPGLLPPSSITYLSPASSSEAIDEKGNTILQGCLEGETTVVKLDTVSCVDLDQSKVGEGPTSECVDDTLVASDFTFPENNLTPGDGVRTVSALAVKTCTNITKSRETSTDKCSLPEPVPTQTQNSPAGNKEEFDGDGNTILVAYLEGETTGTKLDTVSCVDPDQSKVGEGPTSECQDDTFVASDFFYPENDMQIGDGIRTVSAVGVKTCTNITKSRETSIDKCSLPEPIPTQTQKSPAGNKEELDGDGNTILVAYLEGETTGTKLDVISCINPNQSKVGEGPTSECVDDTLVASDFTFPENNLTPGDGIVTVYADGFNTCTNITKNTVVDNSLCVLPETLPHIDYVSPAGERDVYVENAVDDKVTLSFLEGENFETMDVGAKLAMIDAVLVCKQNFRKVSGACLNGVVSVSPGTNHTCAVLSNGSLKCWGRNNYGQLGDGGTSDSNVPVQVAGLSSGVVSVSSGQYHTCAVLSSGSVKCWGSNSGGRLGDGGTSSSPVPVQVTGLTSGVVSVSTGTYHTCAVLSSGSAKCWGGNGSGQIGDGSTSSRSVPVQVTGLSSGVAMVSAGGGHTCAVLSNDSVKCWGDNNYGQLGDGSTSERHVPVQVTGLSSGVVSVSSGTYHTCAVLSSGSVKCWGDNTFGQLGDGSTSERHAPVQVTGLSSGVASVSSGLGYTCAVLSNDSVKCWGRNGRGQLGDGSTSSSTVPVQVTGLSSGVAMVNAGEEHTCAVLSNNSVKCWGHNNYGKLGDGGTSNSSVPVDVLNSLFD